MALLPFNERDRKYILLAFRIIGDFGATIAVPVVLFVLFGQWLDEKYGAGPWLMISGLVTAAVFSGVLVYRKAKRYGEEFQSLEGNDKYQSSNVKSSSKSKE